MVGFTGDELTDRFIEDERRESFGDYEPRFYKEKYYEHNFGVNGGDYSDFFKAMDINGPSEDYLLRMRIEPILGKPKYSR